ncbi:STY4526/YPO1902 family pathogenicity island replication protein, partial [Escherichia coli]|uniref:STY4526/YPO1902 family pathogenicity island replication protein n=1 Tax=Escherichia coli TaxID=562 RepID=UPI001FCCD020
MNNSLSQATNGLLMQLVMDLRSGYLRRCESLGLAREEMQMLQGLTIEEIHYLSNSEVSVTGGHAVRKVYGVTQSYKTVHATRQD